jgi:hypothetical protein
MAIKVEQRASSNSYGTRNLLQNKFNQDYKLFMGMIFMFFRASIGGFVLSTLVEKTLSMTLDL